MQPAPKAFPDPHPLSAGVERSAVLEGEARSCMSHDLPRARTLAAKAAGLARAHPDASQLARCLITLSRCERRLSNFAVAEAQAHEALDVFRSLGDTEGESHALLLLGVVLCELGRYGPSVERLREALSANRRLGVVERQASCLNSLSFVFLTLGDYATALSYQLKALDLHAKLDDPLGKAICQDSVALIYARLGRHDDARGALQEGLALSRTAGDARTTAQLLRTLAELETTSAAPGAALAALTEGLPLAQDLGDVLTQAELLDGLAAAHAACGDVPRALAFHAQAFALAGDLHDPRLDVRLQTHHGQTLLSHDPAAAQSALQRALAGAERLGLTAEQRDAHALLVGACQALGAFEAALRHHERFHALERELFNEAQDRRTQALLIRHEVERARRSEREQRRLNADLRRANDALTLAQRENEALLAQVRHQAQHDALTGLPNRVLFEDRLRTAVARAARAGHVFGVMFLDLDGFKLINDTLGHDAGDELLAEVARRLQAVLRESDTVARLGGDEFTIIADQLAAPEDASFVAHKLLACLQVPFELRGCTVAVGASIGVSVYPHDGQDAATLQRHADVAMYQVKRGGKSQVQLYSAGMDSAALEQVYLESQLRGALARDEFQLHYQPQFDGASGNIVGFEALLRWTDAKLGAVAPGRFIPIAEDTGLIVEIGAWVLERACAQLSAWRRAGYAVQLAVNVSPVQLSRNNFVAHVADSLARFGIPPGALELELTERATMGDPEVAHNQLLALRALGVRVSIDDFGAGNSALSNLLGLPIDQIKVDRQFVQGVDTIPEMRKVVGALVALSHALGFGVVAEGVETAAQLEVVRSLGCERTQGYWQGRPIPAAVATALLKQAFADPGP